jgi:16S rRNA (cytosine967-C5)-methyltransferase
MFGAILRVAEQVVLAADREHPADGVLRETLKAERDLSPEDRRAVSETVFAWYRWQGWRDPKRRLRDQIAAAADMAHDYAINPGRFPEDELLARAVPGWLAEVMQVDARWVRTLQAAPKLWLRARRNLGPEVATELGHCEPFGGGALADTLEYRGDEDLFRTPAFHAGKFELQDISSQAVGFICAPKAGETWWDACAGEGGKLLHLSGLMANKGLIWASDVAEWRLQRLKRRASRAQVFNYRSVAWNGGPKLPTKTKFDGVLLDAPCSGIGTWQRNPHARWTLTPQDVTELAELQGRLLAHAAGAVKPGGRLVYAVCTVTRQETTAVADLFEKQIPGFAPVTFSDPLSPKVPAAARIQYMPQQHDGTGMFVAVWERLRA